MQNKNYMYKGAVHIHSKLSDGTGDLKSITIAAKKAGLDFIIITDHNHYDNDEGIINDIYVIKGEEISPQTYNHYLAFGINECIAPDENPSVYIKKVRTQGGFGFAAHPDEGINCYGEKRKNSHQCIPWVDKNIKPDGVEIWNWFSNWADNLNDCSIFHLAHSYLFKHNLVTSPSKQTLEWWDKLNNESEQIIPAIGGVDAHAMKFYRYIIPVTVFPYKTCFSTITNFINLKEKLSADFTIAKKQILEALRSGRNIILNRHICKEAPLIYITNSCGKFFCGEDIALDDKCCLHFESKNVMNICLIYNGEKIKEFAARKINEPVTEAGKYRLEVTYRGKGCVYTNPFVIKEKV